MNKLVRKGVFETNSSSTHSISINFNDIDMDTILPDTDGRIVLEGGEFGWDWEDFTEARVKANYCAVAFLTLKEEESINTLKKLILDMTGAKEVVFDIYTKDVPDGKEFSYIDHQSCVDTNAKHVPRGYEKLKAFIFNRKSVLTTGNDNKSRYEYNNGDSYF